MKFGGLLLVLTASAFDVTTAFIVRRAYSRRRREEIRQKERRQKENSYNACRYIKSVLPSDQCDDYYSYENIYKPGGFTDKMTMYEYYNSHCDNNFKMPGLVGAMLFWLGVFIIIRFTII